MNELHNAPADAIRFGLMQLFQESGREDRQLLLQIEEVIAENVRLKQEIAQLRRIPSSQGSSSMSTRLRDALRE